MHPGHFAVCFWLFLLTIVSCTKMDQIDQSIKAHTAAMSDKAPRLTGR